MMAKRVCFLMGAIALSGGTYVIFQHASFMADQGYDVTLAVMEPFTATTAAWHDHAGRLRCLTLDEAVGESFDLVVATWWKTALEMPRFRAPRYAYFVQSIESRFYPISEKPLRALVDATYRLPVAYVTEATWIAEHLKLHFGQAAALVRNGIRKDIYKPEGPAHAPRPAGQPRVLIEGHFGVPFKNTALALRLAKEAGAHDIWVMTGSPVSDLPGVSRLFSRVPIHETPKVYRSCDILLKLSTVEGMFGPPLEIFHCGGTAVVLDVTGHDEYIRAGYNAVVVRDRDVDEVVREIKVLLGDPAKLLALKTGALETAEAWPSWEESSRAFTGWIDTVLNGPETDHTAIEAIVRKAWHTYGEAEKQRLAGNPSIKWKYRAVGLARRLPRRAQDWIKALVTLKEVMTPARKVQ